MTTDLRISRYLDVSILMSWLSARQYAPDGGFAGPTNKLVDGCITLGWGVVGPCWKPQLIVHIQMKAW